MKTTAPNLDPIAVVTALQDIIPFKKEGDRWVANDGNALVEKLDRKLSLMVTIPNQNLFAVQRSSALLIQFGQTVLPDWDAATWLKRAMSLGLGTEKATIQGVAVAIIKTPGAVLLTFERKGFG